MPTKDKRVGAYGIFEDNELIYIGKTNGYRWFDSSTNRKELL